MHLKPLLENNFGDPPSEPFPVAIVVGELVKHYTYDAFGRLIRVQSPWPEPGEWSHDLRSERLYYDGLRRIQEVIIDPLLPMSMALSGEGGSQLQSAANQVVFNAESPLDGAASPATLESQALLGENMPATQTYLSREYIWGPGDWGVDELLVQYDQGRRASWPLQDAGGDVKQTAGDYKGMPKRVALQMKKLKRKGLKPAVSRIREFDRRKKAVNWESTSISSAVKRGHKLIGNKRRPR